jgi:hypothetical protein
MLRPLLVALGGEAGFGSKLIESLAFGQEETMIQSALRLLAQKDEEREEELARKAS